MGASAVLEAVTIRALKLCVEEPAEEGAWGVVGS